MNLHLRPLAAICSWLAFESVVAAQQASDDDRRALLRAECVVVSHLAQSEIDAGRLSLADLRAAGKHLFSAKFTVADGAGRPRASGSTVPRKRGATNGVPFARSAGPDANACAGCHNDPVAGGAGDFVANVFVGLGAQSPVNYSLKPDFSAERGTPELHGIGVVEILAREISTQLQRQRDEAVRDAVRTRTPATRQLSAKGISFGTIEAAADGAVNYDRLDGIDRDLVVKPFNQKGEIISIREFTINALNLHHGMQADERFGKALTGSDDFDEDQIPIELTVGDVTALTIFQATLPAPRQILPEPPEARERVLRGEALFTQVKCAACHVPELPIDSPIFTEPGPFNLEGTLSSRDVKTPFAIDLSRQGPASGVVRRPDGSWAARVFSDFKRHRIADGERDHFANEIVVQRWIPADVFLTRRLWAVGSTAPYGHRGDITTIFEAIDHHGGEATESRRQFAALPRDDKQAVVEFLRSLRIAPE